jgi:hypothetical protein
MHQFLVLVAWVAGAQERNFQITLQQGPPTRAVVAVVLVEMQHLVHQALVVLGSLLFGILIIMRQLLPPQVRQQ